MPFDRFKLRARERELGKARRDKFRSEGRCTVCGGAPAEGRMLCQKCQSKRSGGMSKYKARKLAIGVCAKCESPSIPGKAYCRECLNLLASYRAKKVANRRAAGLCEQCGINKPQPESAYCIDCHMKKYAYNSGDASLWQNIKQLYFEQHGRCFYTGAEIKIGAKSDAEKASLDHIVPVTKGGKTEMSNLCWASFLVNKMKYNLSHEEFVGVCTAIAVRCGGLVKEQEALRG